MFGLMNLDSGKVWSSDLSQDDYVKIDNYTYRIEPARVVAVPKDYINWNKEDFAGVDDLK